jgi:hypothetical protein
MGDLGIVEPRDGAQGRGLAGAVAAEQGEDLAFVHVEADALHDVALAVVGMHVVDREEGRRGGRMVGVLRKSRARLLSAARVFTDASFMPLLPDRLPSPSGALDVFGNVFDQRRALRENGDPLGEREHHMHVVFDDAMVMSRLAWISFSRSMVLLVSARAMPAVGSSSSSRLRLLHQAHGHLQAPLVAARQRAACMSRLSIMLTSSSISSAFSMIALLALDAFHGMHPEDPSRLAKQGMSMFSMTVRSPKISGVWNTRLMPIWLISTACARAPTDRRKVTDPVSGSACRPARSARSTCPAPFGPMMACTEFSATDRFTSPRACKPPKRLLTFLTSRIPIVEMSPVRPHAVGLG